MARFHSFWWLYTHTHTQTHTYIYTHHIFIHSSTVKLVSWFCVWPITVKSLISHSPLTIPKVSPTDLQSQMFWRFTFLMWDPWAREPDVGLRPLPPWEKCLYLWLSSHMWFCKSWLYCVSTIPVSWFLLFIFNCRSFLLFFRSFPARAAM